MITIVKKYQQYLDSLPELIANSPYKTEYFIKQLGLKTATYYRKLRGKTFTLKEIEKITVLLFPKEAYLEEMLQDIEEGRNDIKEGRAISNEVMLEKIQKQREQLRL